MKFINHPFFRFLFVGGFNTLFTYVLFVALLLVFAYPVAYTVSYISGIVTSYILVSRIVFRQRLAWRKGFQYPVVYIVQYVLGLIVITVLVEWANLDPRLASLVNIIVLIPVTFLLSRFILVGRNQHQNPWAQERIREEEDSVLQD